MSSIYNVLLVINPIAGGNDKSPIINAVENACAKKNLTLKKYETDGENDEQNILEINKEFKADRILVSGGDGTIVCIAEIARKIDVALGILPSGSANGLAVNLDIPDDLDKQIEIALGDHLIDFDMLEINGHPSLHIADVGINAALIRNYDESSIRGKFGYLINTIPTLIQEDFPFKYKIEANGETHDEEGIMVAIANASKFGTGANINPTGKVNDGKFEVLVFKKLDIWEILKTLKGDTAQDPDFVKTICTDQVTIYCKKPVALQVDGEFIGNETKVEAHINKTALQIAVPEEFVNN